jgi:hypothetical protein
VLYGVWVATFEVKVRIYYFGYGRPLPGRNRQNPALSLKGCVFPLTRPYLDVQPLDNTQGYQAVLSSLIGFIVNLCLSHHDQLRSNAVGILFGMIISEYHQYGHFDQIETELVRKLDSLFMSQSKGDYKSFIHQLRHLFESPEVDDQLRERVSAFLDSVEAFIKLLSNVRRLPEGEEFADDRVIATVSNLTLIEHPNEILKCFLFLAAPDEFYPRHW